MRLIILILFLTINWIGLSQILPPNYSPTLLSRENANIFVNNSLDNGKLKISIRQMGAKQTGQISRNDGQIPIKNYTFQITFENIYDSYVFLKVLNGNHITQKGPAYPNFSACTYGATTRLYIQTNQKMFVLGPGDKKVFNAYTNQDHIANFYYPSTYKEYQENLKKYGEWYEPLCVNFPIAKHFVPKNKLVTNSGNNNNNNNSNTNTNTNSNTNTNANSNTNTNTNSNSNSNSNNSGIDVDGLLNELENETEKETKTNQVNQNENEIEVLNNNSNKIEGYGENGNVVKAKNYDVNACNRSKQETKQLYEKYMGLLRNSTSGNYARVTSALANFNNPEANLSYTLKAIEAGKLSPNCLEQLDDLNVEYSNKIQQEVNNYLNKLKAGGTGISNQSGGYSIKLPNFSTRTTMTKTYKKKSGSTSKNKGKFADGKLKIPDKFTGTIPNRKKQRQNSPI
jgi:hypothetical protein